VPDPKDHVLVNAPGEDDWLLEQDANFRPHVVGVCGSPEYRLPVL
jgi:hypothetical protein